MLPFPGSAPSSTSDTDIITKAAGTSVNWTSDGKSKGYEHAHTCIVYMSDTVEGAWWAPQLGKYVKWVILNQDTS